MFKTYQAKPHEVVHKWYVVDATDKPIGRLASQVAKILRGKNKPIFTPHVDTGDFVIIINAEKAKMTGTNKADEQIYWHTMYPGGIRSVSRGKLFDTRPEKTIERAVKGMIPHNKLGAQVFSKLKIYAGPEHPHEAQMPEILDLV